MPAGGFIEQTLGSLFGYRNHAEPFEILQSVKDTLKDESATERLLNSCGLPITHQSEEELEQSWYISAVKNWRIWPNGISWAAKSKNLTK